MSKEPWVAAILSLILPGVGHVYAGRAKRGLSIFCGATVVGALMAAYAFHPSTLVGLPLLLAAIGFQATLTLYVPIDAYRSAKAWNLQRNAPRLSPWRRSLLIVAALLFLLLLNPVKLIARYVIKNVAQAFQVEASSMEPTLLPYDRVIADMRIYRSHEPHRGDLVVLRYPLNPERIFLKRIVGLPGERIDISGGVIRINGRLLADTYATPSDIIRSCSGSYGPAVVPADMLFVLGDNWCKSEDSRSFGFVHRGFLIGKVTKIYYPFGRSGAVR